MHFIDCGFGVIVGIVQHIVFPLCIAVKQQKVLYNRLID
jgi:hypothetical protein